jgi:hypothetical protein
MKNLSPQNRDVAEAVGMERRSDFGSKFFERPTIMSSRIHTHNEVALQ